MKCFVEELLELSGMKLCGCLVSGLGSTCARSCVLSGGCVFACYCLFFLVFTCYLVPWAQSDSLKLQLLAPAVCLSFTALEALVLVLPCRYD